MDHLVFDNRFTHDLPGDPDLTARRRQVLGALWSHVLPTPVAAPRLIAHSREVAGLLDLTPEDVASPAFAEVLGGNRLLPGMAPFAANYGGHQFGSWAGQLGDGRAISLGEVVNAAGERWELQLKGAGPTPYSRTADGRAVLRSSVREFLCSEAMFHLGVPTTRALSLVQTGDQVVRDMLYDGHPRFEPGAVVCRVAPSFIRFGHFELPASRRDLALLRTLVDFTIHRDFPEIQAEPRLLDDATARYARFFEAVCERTAILVAHWQRVGFVHGVMNTDNMSILGLTIDYGPYGWLDDYDPTWTPNTTDAHGRRYRFGQQPDVAQWNLKCLAEALVPLFPDVAPLQAGLERFGAVYTETFRTMVAAKFGLRELLPGDTALIEQAFSLMHAAEVDMTWLFRLLAHVDVQAPALTVLHEAFYRPELLQMHAEAWQAWLQQYAARVRQDAEAPEVRRARMDAVNPRFVLRNYLAQEAIDLAEQGDPSRIHALLDTLRHPYREQPDRQAFAAKRPDWARNRPGCSMLSCSS